MNHARFVSLSAALVVSAILALPETGQAIPPTVIQLSDGNTTASVDISSGGGMNQWTVGGQNQPNQLNQQWFWYRVGNGAQAPINTIAPPTYSNTANTLNTIYANTDYSVTVDYTLNDEGIGKADIGEVVTIQNTTGADLDFHFFQYSDFNLAGIATGDMIKVDNYDAYQSKGSTAIAEGIIDPTADHYEANTTGGTSSTLYRLNHTSNLQLQDYASASGDVTWAFEWDLTLSAAGTANDTVQILKDKYLHITLVPEPSTMALIALGLTACGLARRRQ